MEIPETVSTEVPLKSARAAFVLIGFSTKLIKPKIVPDSAKATISKTGKTLIKKHLLIRRYANT